MTIYDTRVTNTKQLIGTSRGCMSAFAVKMEMSKQQVSHVLGERREKNIGDKLARKIEQVYANPVGWLDQDHGARPGPAGEHIEVPLLSEAAALSAADGDITISQITVSKDWARRNVPCAPEHIAILIATGDTMSPTFEDGSLLFVDRGGTKVTADGVYAIAKGADIHVLRVKRSLTGGYTVSSDNAAYPPAQIENFGKAGLLILGRVLFAMSPTRV